MSFPLAEAANLRKVMSAKKRQSYIVDFHRRQSNRSILVWKQTIKQEAALIPYTRLPHELN